METLVGPKQGQLTARNLAIHQHSNPPSTQLTVAAFVHAQTQLHKARGQLSRDSPEGHAHRDLKLKNARHRPSNDGGLHEKCNTSHESTLSVNRPTVHRSQKPSNELRSIRLTQQHSPQLADARTQQPMLNYSRSDSVPLQPRVSSLLPQPVPETLQDSKVAVEKPKEPIRRQKKQMKAEKEEKQGKKGENREQDDRKRDERSPSIIDRNHVLKERKERRQKNKKGTQSQPKPARSRHSSNEPSRRRKRRSKGALSTSVERLPDSRQPEAAKQRSRLTIEPEATYGIFGKGVSGGSTAARLMRNKPSRDLVFNELSFLDKKRSRKHAAEPKSNRTKNERTHSKRSTDSSMTSVCQESSTERPEPHVKAQRDQAPAPSRARRRITSASDLSRTHTRTWPGESDSIDRSPTPGMHSANSIRLRAAKSGARRQEKRKEGSRKDLETRVVSNHQSVSASEDLRSLPFTDQNSALDQFASLVPDQYSSARPDRNLVADSDLYSNADRSSNSMLAPYSSAVPDPYSTAISNQYLSAGPDRDSPVVVDPYPTTNSIRYLRAVPDGYSAVTSNEYLPEMPDWNTRPVPDRFLYPVPNQYSPPPAHEDSRLDRYAADSQGSTARSVGRWMEPTEPDWGERGVLSGPTRSWNYEGSPGRSSTVELPRGSSSPDSMTWSMRGRSELGFSGQWMDGLGGLEGWNSEWIGGGVCSESETKSEPDWGEVGAGNDAEEEMARLEQIITACGGANEQQSTGDGSSMGYLEQDVRVDLDEQCFVRSEWQPD